MGTELSPATERGPGRVALGSEAAALRLPKKTCLKNFESPASAPAPVSNIPRPRIKRPRHRSAHTLQLGISNLAINKRHRHKGIDHRVVHLDPHLLRLLQIRLPLHVVV